MTDTIYNDPGTLSARFVRVSLLVELLTEHSIDAQFPADQNVAGIDVVDGFRVNYFLDKQRYAYPEDQGFYESALKGILAQDKRDPIKRIIISNVEFVEGEENYVRVTSATINSHHVLNAQHGIPNYPDVFPVVCKGSE